MNVANRNLSSVLMELEFHTLWTEPAWDQLCQHHAVDASYIYCSNISISEQVHCMSALLSHIWNTDENVYIFRCGNTRAKWISIHNNCIECYGVGCHHGLHNTSTWHSFFFYCTLTFGVKIGNCLCFVGRADNLNRIKNVRLDLFVAHILLLFFCHFQVSIEKRKPAVYPIYSGLFEAD